MVPPRYSEERLKNLRLDDINTLAQAFKDTLLETSKIRNIDKVYWLSNANHFI